MGFFQQNTLLSFNSHLDGGKIKMEKIVELLLYHNKSYLSPFEMQKCNLIVFLIKKKVSRKSKMEHKLLPML